LTISDFLEKLKEDKVLKKKIGEIMHLVSNVNRLTPKSKEVK
jgi:hypothetical protein